MKRLGKCRESRFAEPLYNDSSACDVVRCLPAVQNGVCPYKVEPCSVVLQNAGRPTSTAAGIDVNHSPHPHRVCASAGSVLDISKYRDTCERSISILGGIAILRYIE